MRIRFESNCRLGEVVYYKGQWADLPKEQACNLIARSVARSEDEFPAETDWPLTLTDWAQRYHPKDIAQARLSEDELCRIVDGLMPQDEKEAVSSRRRGAIERLQAALLDEIERRIVRLVYRVLRVLAKQPDGSLGVVPAPPGDPFKPWKEVPNKEVDEMIKGRAGIHGFLGIKFAAPEPGKIQRGGHEIEVRVDLAGPTRASAARKMGNLAAETRCMEWLLTEAAAGPKRKSKAACLLEAKEKFPRLSKADFNRAWRRMTEEYPTWAKPGRPKTVST